MASTNSIFFLLLIVVTILMSVYVCTERAALRVFVMSLLVARIGVSSAPISFALPGKIQQQRAATTRRSFAKPRAIGSKCKRQSPLCRRGDDVDIADRVVAAVAYTLPLLDGLKYGRPTLSLFFFLKKKIVCIHIY